MRKRSTRRSKVRPVSRSKAREILHDGTAQGHPLTDRQRRFFGAISSGQPVKRRTGRKRYR